MKYDVVKRGALGRSANLGDLYDVYADKFTEASLFLKPEYADEAKTKTDMKYVTKTAFTLEETLSKRLQGLEIPTEQALGLLCGLHDHDLRGYEELIGWKKKSNKSIRGTLIYSIFAYEEKIDFKKQFDRSKDFIKMSRRGFLSQSSHVVSGVAWGARIIVSIDCAVPFEKSREKISSLFERFLQEFSHSISDLTALKAKLDEFTQLDVSVKINGDVEIDPVLEIKNIEELLDNFPKLVETASIRHPRSIFFTMFPLLKIPEIKISDLDVRPAASGTTPFQLSAIENYFFEVNEVVCDLIDFINDIDYNRESKLCPRNHKKRDIIDHKEDLARKILKQKMDLKTMISRDRLQSTHRSTNTWSSVDKLRGNLPISKIKETVTTYEESRMGLKYLSELKRRKCFLLADEKDLNSRINLIDDFYVLHYSPKTAYIFSHSEWRRNYDLFHNIISLTESNDTIRVFAMEHEKGLFASLLEKTGLTRHSNVQIAHYYLHNKISSDCLTDRDDCLIASFLSNSEKANKSSTKRSTASSDFSKTSGVENNRDMKNKPYSDCSLTRFEQSRDEFEHHHETKKEENIPESHQETNHVEQTRQLTNGFETNLNAGNETYDSGSQAYPVVFGTTSNLLGGYNFREITEITLKSDELVHRGDSLKDSVNGCGNYSSQEENGKDLYRGNASYFVQGHGQSSTEEPHAKLLETDIDNEDVNQNLSDSSSESSPEKNNSNQNSSNVQQDPLGASNFHAKPPKSKHRGKKDKKGKNRGKTEHSSTVGGKVENKGSASIELVQVEETQNPLFRLFSEQSASDGIETTTTEHINVECLAKPDDSYHLDSINTKENMVPLEIACPASLYNKCKLSGTHIFHCAICSKVLYYGFDRNIYCEDCGKASATSFAFKCSHPSHEDDFFRFESGDDLLGMLEKLKKRDELNILILGETGVGKSTFINAFANYLNYDTLDVAEKSELISLIPTSFTLSDENYDIIEVKFGDEDQNEANDEGASKTQSCKAYCFPCGEKMVRLIDTPGIGDTRGIDQDAKNFVNILGFISNYTDIHGILLLMKPNNSRLNIFFRFCIQELLKHLHKSASENITFVFTNSKSTFYKPGDTFTPLKKLLGQLKDVQIPLNQETVYCLDNDAFRFLVALRNLVSFEEGDREDYSFSWNKSASECDRLLKHIDKLKPHCVKETLSINEARRLIISLVQPLGDIVMVIQENLFYLNSQIESLQSSKNNLQKLQGNLYVPVVDAQFIPLKEPRTVCKSEKCVVMEGDNTIDKICHDPCYLSNVTPDVVNNKELKSCLVFRNDFCSTCGCSWTEHIHQRYVVKKAYVKTMNRSTASEMQDWRLRKEKAEEVKAELELQRSNYMDELDFVIKASAMFSHFLTSNSITHQADSIVIYLDFLINKEKAKQSIANSDAFNVNLVSELEKVKTGYSKQLLVNQQNPNYCNAQAVEVHVSMLYALRIFGERFKCISEQHERAVAREITSHSERVYVPKSGPRRFDFTK